ncbi:MAG: family 1 glycosylhydrolase [Actinomycetota bacterium]|nr:family 1 glycosylhydrolase [Actinomycetota bacterium]
MSPTHTRGGAFPAGFLWGASTAGHQVEGGNVNADLWPVEWGAETHFTEPSGDACDHYHRYAEDIALLREVGLNAYRFSIEWSRIEPEPGFFSRAALEHYRRMISTCLESGVTPVVSYSHFTLPRWMAGQGGWASETAADHFARYAARLTRHVGDLVEWVCTLNEPNVMSLLEHTGVIPMGTSDRAAPGAAGSEPSGVGGHDPARYRPGLSSADLDHMAEAHRRAVTEIKSGPGRQKVGWTLALIDLQSGPGGEERCRRARRHGEEDWLDVSRDDDFVGVQTYSRTVLGPEGQIPPGEDAPTMQTGWEVYPPALGHTVALAAERAQVPVLVTENGMATDDDRARIVYTHGALEGLAACIEAGIDVRGYLHWSLLDNFEWTAGYAKTFGLISFDPETFARTVKPSARWLGQVARGNALSPPGP